MLADENVLTHVLVHFIAILSLLNVFSHVTDCTEAKTMSHVPPVQFEAAVMSPFALTVMLAFVNVPTSEFTVARVRAVAHVASHVCVAFDTRPEYCEFVALSHVFVPL